MPRLSSPLSAKASVRSPYALDRSQQNSCVGTESVRLRYETQVDAHTCSFDLSFQTMMSSQVDPGTPGYGADKPFNSRCHLASAGLRPELETRIFRDRFRFDDGGARRDRSDDLMLAKHALYQLSYGPLGT